MENKIYGYVYLLTNRINGKQYVGKTTMGIEKRFKIHCYNSKYKKTYSGRAINKYGKENFIVQELAIAYNKKELKFLEELYIKWFETFVPNGYNLKEISGGFDKHSKETIEKMKIIQNSPKHFEQNSKNGIKSRGRKLLGKSKYIGVYTKGKKFISSIGFNGSIHLGYYNNEADAAKAYDIKAIELFGNDCILNFPELRKDYIDGKIIVNKNVSKSGIKGIYFNKRINKWYFQTIDELGKKKSKFFTSLNKAIEYKTTQDL